MSQNTQQRIREAITKGLRKSAPVSIQELFVVACVKEKFWGPAIRREISAMQAEGVLETVPRKGLSPLYQRKGKAK